jgi:hypothetical protein
VIFIAKQFDDQELAIRVDILPKLESFWIAEVDITLLD